ncbi:MAG: hypothetical protein FJ104_08915 [Deltaproteobacteria bacterium]|nr:hypothetical protein [Deltaproteobacteria bacterium]
MNHAAQLCLLISLASAVIGCAGGGSSGSDSAGSTSAECTNGQQPVYETPGCDGAVEPVCGGPGFDACMGLACGCDGRWFDSCGSWDRPWTEDTSLCGPEPTICESRDGGAEVCGPSFRECPGDLNCACIGADAECSCTDVSRNRVLLQCPAQ